MHIKSNEESNRRVAGGTVLKTFVGGSFGTTQDALPADAVPYETCLRLNLVGFPASLDWKSMYVVFKIEYVGQAVFAKSAKAL